MALNDEERRIEFLSLMETVDWSAAVTARRLHMSEGSISGYTTGKNSPPLKTLELMRSKVMEEELRKEDEQAATTKPEAEVQEFKLSESDEKVPQAFLDAIGELNYLRKADRRAYDHLVSSIHFCFERSRSEWKKLKDSSSAPVSFEKGVAAAVETVKRPGVIYGRSRKAASTNDKTSSPTSGADKESEHKQ
jgi:hypothetical protein